MLIRAMHTISSKPKKIRCQICGNARLVPVIDLGHQPSCDVLPNADELKEKRDVYPLIVVRCTQCGLVQISYIIPPQIVFHKKYPYRSGITQMLVDNFKDLARETKKRFGLTEKDLVIDIGSNDGTALAQFKNEGMRILGIEPTDSAKIANKSDIPTIQEFFTEALAKEVVKKHGEAKVVIATNVFAHVPSVVSFASGIRRLLSDGGVFISESQYLFDTIEKLQYDCMYHEHLRFYSLKPMIRLFQGAGLTVIDAERISAAGGSIRVFAAKGRGFKPSVRLQELLKAEEAFGLYKEETYTRFRKKVERSRLELTKLLAELRLSGKSIAGIGSPGRSSPILNFCHIDRVLVPYLAEQQTSLKLGLYSPGTHIPVVDEKRLFEEQPDYALLLSWHIANTLIPKLRSRGLKSKIILPLPNVTIVE